METIDYKAAWSAVLHFILMYKWTFCDRNLPGAGEGHASTSKSGVQQPAQPPNVWPPKKIRNLIKHHTLNCCSLIAAFQVGCPTTVESARHAAKIFDSFDAGLKPK